MFILFYSITLEGRRGTTDEFATTPFHLVVFSASLVELAKSIPVYSLMLSSYQRRRKVKNIGGPRFRILGGGKFPAGT